jgi:hypothetical protein
MISGHLVINSSRDVALSIYSTGSLALTQTGSIVRYSERSHRAFSDK